MDQNFWAKVYFLDTRGLSYGDVNAKYHDLIESHRKSRIEKCARLSSKENLLYTGAALEYALSRHGASASEVVIGEHGKPYLNGRDDLHFNISHSGTFVAVTVANGPVGIDIQKPVKRRDSLVKRIATPEEQAEYAELINERFNLFWALKESCSKLTGEGIGMDFRGIVLEEFTDKILRLRTTSCAQDDTSPKAFGRICEDIPDHPTVVTMFERFDLTSEYITL